MNINNLRQNPKTKYLFYFILFLPFLVIPLLLSNSKLKSPNSNNTVPLLPSVTPKSIKSFPESIKSPFLPEDQKVTFDWKGVTVNLPNSAQRYSINTPLINSSSIISLSNKLNFVASNKSTETSEGSFLWINKDSSLFASIPQKRIIFSYTSELPSPNKEVSRNDAISSAKQILSNLLGVNFTNTLDGDPEVRYFKLDTKEVEGEPTETSASNANTIQVTFNQSIGSLPVVYQSRNSELLSVLLDTNKKLFRLDLYGGFDQVSQVTSVKLQNFEQLQESAKRSPLRITYSKDMGSERAYYNSKNINVEVKDLTLGYFEFNNTLEPVFVIKGIMSSKGIPPFPATYIVPAESN